MKDGVPFRDRVDVDFGTNAEAITHCKEMAKYYHYRDNGLRDDQDLEIAVVNEVGREIEIDLSPGCSSQTGVRPPQLEAFPL